MAEIVISKYLDTPLVTAFIDNKLDALTKQIDKLKNNTLYKPNFFKKIESELY